MDYQVRETGIVYGSERARPELLEPPREGEHVWIMTMAYRIPNDTVMDVANGRRGLDMDAENLAMAAIGCWACETEYADRMTYRRCPGEPRR